MADIFISYSQADREQVRRIVDALTRWGWSVWWDPQILAGEQYDSVIERELDAARCIIVVWSRNSLPSKNVRNEAVVGRQSSRLIQVTLGDASYPSTFAGWQAVDLSAWTGDTTDRRFQELCGGVRRLVGGEPSRQKDSVADFFARIRQSLSKNSSPIDLSRPQELVDGITAAHAYARQQNETFSVQSVLAGPHGPRVMKALESVCHECALRKTSQILVPLDDSARVPLGQIISDLFKAPDKISPNIKRNAVPYEIDFRPDLVTPRKRV